MPEPSATTPVVPTTSTQYELRDRAAWIRLTRPEKKNAIGPDVLAGIADGLDRSLEDGARSVVITGSGGVFCAGADLAHVLGGLDDLSGIEALLEDAGQLMRRIEQHPLPVIAAVDGIAMAGGLELVLACDIVIATTEARLADGHANYGLFPGAGATVRLPRRIGDARAKYLMFTGLPATAEAMREAGLVNQVVAPDALEATVRQLCGRLAQTSGEGIARMKRVVDESWNLTTEDALAAELDAAREHLRSADVAEGLAAFAEGRRPDFNQTRGAA